MRSKFLIGLVGIIFFASAFQGLDFQKKPWPVPDAAKNKKNPVAANAQSVATGKSLWSTHCKSCHGIKGLGDGPKASQLKTDPGDFSKADFHAQTDGSLYYKTAEGRDDMPAFKKKIPDPEDIWNLVHFIRTMKKGGTTVPVVKDTATKKVDKVVNVIPPARKDTAVKKVDKPTKTDPPIKKDTISKVHTETNQDQISRLNARLDSLGKEVGKLKERMDAIRKDSNSKN